MASHFNSFVLPAIMMQKLRDMQSNDLETAKKRRGYLHAFVMLACLTVLLSVIYFSQEPYRYTVTSKAFQGKLHLSQLQEAEGGGELDRAEVWEWFDHLLEDLGGESTQSVQLNCAYDDKKSQLVRIDGVNYFLVDPASDESACPPTHLAYIEGAEDRVFLAGAHQVLSFGAFSTRSRLERPLAGSVISSQQTSLTVAESGDADVGSLTDDRVVSLCRVSREALSDAFCIAEDAFLGSVGSTFAWKGERDDNWLTGFATCFYDVIASNLLYIYFIFHWHALAGEQVIADGDTYFAFEAGASAVLFVHELHNYTAVVPCYSSDGAGGVTATAGLGAGGDLSLDLSLTCSLVWVTPGRTVRDNCLRALGDQATPLQAYLAGLQGMPTVSADYEYNYGCSSLLSWPEADMSRVFLEQSRSLSTFLEADSALGAFFPTSSLKNWVEDAHHFSSQLQMSSTLDEQSRKFIVYLVTRNLNEAGLFYSRVKLKFVFSVEGTATVHLDTTFSPMIDFSYGTNDHTWVRACSPPVTVL